MNVAMVLTFFCLVTTGQTLFLNTAKLVKLAVLGRKLFARRENSVCYDYVGCFYRNATFNHVAVLPDTPEQVQTRFMLYTKRNPNLPQFLLYQQPDTVVRSSFYRPGNKVKVIVHGYAESGSIKKFVSLKNALLRLSEDVNVVMVDWRAGAHVRNYLTAAVNCELIARQTAVLITHLMSRGTSPKKIHVIGFSLGAQISGFIGRYLKQQRGVTIARITALDPAATLFIDYGNDIHLRETDADYVDVIHTSHGFNMASGSVGIKKPIGHVDYYPNGGVNQAGCHFLFGFYCDHFRAVYLFTESILSTKCHFLSNSCGLDVDDCAACGSDNNTGSCGRMGYFSDLTRATGVQYLTTKGKYPYCIH